MSPRLLPLLVALAGCVEGELHTDAPAADGEVEPVADGMSDARPGGEGGAAPGDARPAHDAAPPPLDGAAGDVALPPVDGGDAAVQPPEDAAPPPLPDAARPPPPPEGPAVYTPDRTQSPLTPYVGARLRTIAARDPNLRGDVFAKIGDSITVSSHFMRCFAGDAVDLDGRAELGPVIDHFLAGDADGTDPFRRESLSATVGWSALHALRGDPSPADQELAAIAPRFALVMYGTNDIELGNIFRYADDMFDLVDLLTAQGVVPIVSSIPPRDDDADADLWVPRYNAVVRGLAQARQIPFIDLHRELLPLDGHGLGGDHLHPSAFGGGACVFTPDGLHFGYNLRNLTAIEALRRVLDVVVDLGAAPDPPQPVAPGSGTAGDPFEIGALPFTDHRDTRRSSSSILDVYDGCAAAQDESGPEYVYRLVVTAPIVISAWVYDRGDVDVDLHLLDDTLTVAGCLDRDHQRIDASLARGTYYFVLDTFVSDGVPRAGDYLFVVVAEG